MKTATAVQTIYRFSHTERLFFSQKPDPATRLALRAAGWHWDRRGNWWRHVGNTTAISKKQLSVLLTPEPANANAETAATA